MNLKHQLKHLPMLFSCALILSACEQSSSPEPAQTVAEGISIESAIDAAAASTTAIADRYYAATLQQSPEVAYFSGVDLERHDGMEDNSPEARLAAEAVIDKLLSDLEAIDAGKLTGRTEWITHAYLQQALKSSVAERICRTGLWNVNQMGGWHSGYSQIAQLQPTGTAEFRDQSLARWSKFAQYVDQETENLKTGLELGYSAPKTVVQRVIDQVDGLLALEIEKSPYYSPATRDNDTDFARATYALVEGEIYPA